MTRILSSIVAVAGFISLIGETRGDDSIPPETLAAIKKATVFVKVAVEGESYSGSGFVVKNNDGTVHIVTNHHVIEPLMIEIVAEWQSVLPTPTGPHYIPGPHGGQQSVPFSPPNQFSPPTPFGPPSPFGRPAGESRRLRPRLVVRTGKNADITVVFRSGTPEEQSVKARVVGTDGEIDLAILEASGVKNSPEPINCSDEVKISETMPVYSFGFPLGEMLSTGKGSPAITVGKASISALRLDDAGELFLVQIDGALNPGNSGGPVVDTHGRLVGVAVATLRNTHGIGLAIPNKKVPTMWQGRLKTPHVFLVKEPDGSTAMRAEAELIDPFNKVKTASLFYVASNQVEEKPKPADRLNALPGCHEIPLKIHDRTAQGQVTLKKNLSEIRVFFQGESVDDHGQRRYTENTEEQLGPPTNQVAAKQSPEDALPGNIVPYKRPPAAPPTNEAGQFASSPIYDVNDPPKTLEDFATMVSDLNSGDFGRRIQATMRLRMATPTEAHPAIARALVKVLGEETSAPLRCNAAGALEKWGTPDSIPALQEASTSDSDSLVRSRAKVALEAIKRRQ